MGAAQEPENFTMTDLARLDLATDVLSGAGDELLGHSLVLLAGRSCTLRCAVGRQPRQARTPVEHH